MLQYLVNFIVKVRLKLGGHIILYGGSTHRNFEKLYSNRRGPHGANMHGKLFLAHTHE
jgi:hypothetical protein